MNTQKKLQIFLKLLFFILLSVIVLIYCHKLYYILCNIGPNGTSYQFELREGVCLEMAKLFAEGINPYDYAEGTSYPAYMYGWVLPFLLSLFYRFGIVHVSVWAEIFMLIIEIIGCIFFYKLLSEIYGINHVVALFGVLYFTTVYWRYTSFAGLMPDALGITALVFLMYLTLKDEKKGKFRPFLYAIFYVLLFHLKVYFATLALGHLIYLKMKAGWKISITYAIQGIVVGLASIVLVRLLFPTYFTINMYLLTICNVYSFANFFWQFIILGKYYFPLYIAYLLVLYRCFRRKALISYEIIMALVSFVFLIVLGQSNGATYTYFLQLWMPFLIVSFARLCDEYWEILCVKKFGLFVIIVCMFLFMLLPFEFSFSSPQKWKEEREVKGEVYEILDKFEDPSKMKISPYSLVFYCVERNIVHDEYGHSNAYNKELLRIVKSSNTSELVFPYGEQLIEEYLDYLSASDELVSKGYYDVVVINESEKEKYMDSLVDGGYKLWAEYNYNCGVFPQDILIYYRE